MKSTIDNEEYLVLEVNRINTLADGIFAIAMTLLVFNINSSDAVKLFGDELSQYIIKITPAILGYFVSFWVIGIYWSSYSRLLHVSKKLSSFLTQVHLVFLMCIAFLPFPTAIISSHGYDRTAVDLYTISFGITGLLLSFVHGYVLFHRGLIKPGISQKHLKILFIRSLVLPFTFLTSPFIGQYFPKYILFSWIIIYPIGLLIEGFYEKFLPQDKTNEVKA